MADLDHLDMAHMAPPPMSPVFNDFERLGLPVAAKIYLDINFGEGRILAALVRAGGKVVPNSELAREVSWPDVHSQSNAVKVHVYRLREAMRDRGSPGEILTERGVGYSLTRSDEVLELLRAAGALR